MEKIFKSINHLLSDFKKYFNMKIKYHLNVTVLKISQSRQREREKIIK